MAGIYSVVFSAVAVTATQDFFEITPADDKPVQLCGLFLSQHSDVGDAQDEILHYSVIRGHATSGSGGSAPTPRPLGRNQATVGFSAEVNNTTIASAGTGVTVHDDAFNVRAGLALWWPDGFEPEASQADVLLVVRLLAAPADSLTMNGTAYLREL